MACSIMPGVEGRDPAGERVEEALDLAVRDVPVDVPVLSREGASRSSPPSTVSSAARPTRRPSRAMGPQPGTASISVQLIQIAFSHANRMPVRRMFCGRLGFGPAYCVKRQFAVSPPTRAQRRLRPRALTVCSGARRAVPTRPATSRRQLWALAPTATTHRRILASDPHQHVVILFPSSQALQPALHGDHDRGRNRHIRPHLFAVRAGLHPPRAGQGINDGQPAATQIAGACRHRSWHAGAIVVSGQPNMVAMNLHGDADHGASSLDRIRPQLAHHEQAAIDHVTGSRIAGEHLAQESQAELPCSLRC